MKCTVRGIAVLTLSVVVGAASARAQAPVAAAPTSSAAQQSLAQAGEQGKFSYVVFYRDDNDLARAMMQTANAAAANQSTKAATTIVQITNPAEQAVVARFDVARAPMPLTIVTAPNGAIVGVFPQRVTEQQLTETYVTPTMAACMKAMQEKKIVFLCVQTTPQTLVSQGVADFIADDHFKDRTVIVPVQAADPVEAELLAELELGSTPDKPNTVFFAPPGVMVGKFHQASTKAEIAAALHKAGKCCDDPNCKHNQAAKQGANVR